MKIHHEENNFTMTFNPAFKHSIGTGRFHWHENAEFLYIISDGFKVLIDGVLYEPKKGDIIFIDEYSIHRFICESQNITLSLGQFSLKLLLYEYTDIKSIKPHITSEEIARDSDFEQRLFHLIELMKSIGKVRNIEMNSFAKSVFSAFYFLLMEKFPKQEQGKILKREKEAFYDVVEYINEHITENITVINIAQKLYMNRGTLSKMFLKYSGISVNNYINNLRILNVNKMLEKGYSPTDAALESGFQSIRTFNNVYKKHMGITPTQYINKNLTKN